MADRVKKLQSENAKLRDEIKELQCALKNIPKEMCNSSQVFRKVPVPEYKKPAQLQYKFQEPKPKRTFFKEELKKTRDAFTEPYSDKENLDTKNTGTQICLNELQEPLQPKEPLQSQLNIQVSDSFSKKTLKKDHVSFDFDIDDLSLYTPSEQLNKEPLIDKKIDSQLSFESLGFQGTKSGESACPSFLHETFDPQENPKKKLSITESTQYELKDFKKPKKKVKTDILGELNTLREENRKLRMQLKKTPKRSKKVVKSKSSEKIRTNETSKTPKSSKKSKTPKTFSRRTLSKAKFSRSLTPLKKRHCRLCDHLLSKGYSTSFCKRHGEKQYLSSCKLNNTISH